MIFKASVNEYASEIKMIERTYNFIHYFNINIKSIFEKRC